MRSLIGIALVAAGCLAVTPASALTMTPYYDSRSVVAEVCSSATGYCFTSARGPGPGFPTFDFEATSGALPGAVNATQHSSLDALGMQGGGTVDLSVATPNFRGRASSTFAVAFTLDQPAAYSFVGDLQLSVTPPPSPDGSFSARIYASLGWFPTTVAFEQERLSLPPAFEEGGLFIAKTGVLPAGNYWLNVLVRGYQPAPQPSFASMGYSFAFGLEPVPEPSELAYVALTALGLGLLAAVRRTPRYPSATHA